MNHKGLSSWSGDGWAADLVHVPRYDALLSVFHFRPYRSSGRCSYPSLMQSGVDTCTPLSPLCWRDSAASSIDHSACGCRMAAWSRIDRTCDGRAAYHNKYTLLPCHWIGLSYHTHATRSEAVVRGAWK